MAPQCMGLLSGSRFLGLRWVQRILTWCEKLPQNRWEQVSSMVLYALRHKEHLKKTGSRSPRRQCAADALLRRGSPPTRVGLRCSIRCCVCRCCAHNRIITPAPRWGAGRCGVLSGGAVCVRVFLADGRRGERGSCFVEAAGERGRTAEEEKRARSGHAESGCWGKHRLV